MEHCGGYTEDTFERNNTVEREAYRRLLQKRADKDLNEDTGGEEATDLRSTWKVKSAGRNQG